MPSHFRRHGEEQKKHTILYSILGSILLILFLLFLGLPLFTKYILYLGNSRQAANPVPSDGLSYVAPPVLDDSFNATNSANVTISGIATKGQNVKLYVNGSVTNEQQTDDKGKFTFSNVTLQNGSNEIKTKAFTSDGKESDYSNALSINYLNKGPKLTIDSPQDNQTFSGSNSKMLQIQGSTDQNCNVTVNGSWVIVSNAGSFTYNFPLQNGENDLTIVATDTAGNTTTVQKKVTYNP